MIKYKIIGSGSDGNAVILQDNILIDCGVPFKSLKPYYKNLKLVLLTHIHSDHFRKLTVKMLAKNRPLLRFACGSWLVPFLVECGVPTRNIDVLECEKTYNYGVCQVIMFPLFHNVANCGYKVYFPNGKVMYATDTNNLDSIEAKGYDLYMIEANYGDEEIQERIRIKQQVGEYAYEEQVLHNHLSKEKCDAFLYSNMEDNSQFVYMHQHKERASHDNRKDCAV